VDAAGGSRGTGEAVARGHRGRLAARYQAEQCGARQGDCGLTRARGVRPGGGG